MEEWLIKTSVYIKNANMFFIFEYFLPSGTLVV
jgi:hypothetical protein